MRALFILKSSNPHWMTILSLTQHLRNIMLPHPLQSNQHNLIILPTWGCKQRLCQPMMILAQHHHQDQCCHHHHHHHLYQLQHHRSHSPPEFPRKRWQKQNPLLLPYQWRWKSPLSLGKQSPHRLLSQRLANLHWHRNLCKHAWLNDPANVAFKDLDLKPQDKVFASHWKLVNQKVCLHIFIPSYEYHWQWSTILKFWKKQSNNAWTEAVSPAFALPLIILIFHHPSSSEWTQMQSNFALQCFQTLGFAFPMLLTTKAFGWYTLCIHMYSLSFHFLTRKHHWFTHVTVFLCPQHCFQSNIIAFNDNIITSKNNIIAFETNFGLGIIFTLGMGQGIG